MIVHGQRRAGAGRAEPSTEHSGRRSGRRAVLERLLEWADHLAPAERSLVRCAYDWGVSSREISLLTGQTPRVIRRRLRTLLQRVNASPFQTTARLLPTLPDDRRNVARLVILQGLTQRQAATQLGISIHRVRRELLAIEATCEIAASRSQLRL